jgi:hypothetical protein
MRRRWSGLRQLEKKNGKFSKPVPDLSIDEEMLLFTQGSISSARRG